MAVKTIAKKNWVSTFSLIGAVKLPTDEKYSPFELEKESQNSDWIQNVMNLGIDCGDESGTIYCEMRGGYGANRDNVIYTTGKDEEGKDDFSQKIVVSWDERLDEDIVEQIGDMKLISVGLVKGINKVTGKEETYVKKFISAYDAIPYIKENVKDGMVVNVRGNIKYSRYNGRTYAKKEVTSIFLSSVTERENFRATFKQTILINKDSVGKIDKKKNVLPIDARVLDYAKSYDDKPVIVSEDGKVGGNVPFVYPFEYELPTTDEQTIGLIKNTLFKTHKGVTQITFEGKFIESGSTVTITEKDLPDDIKMLIACHAYTLEEALKACADNGGKERRMVLVKPFIKKVVKEGAEEATPVLQKFDDAYTEDELFLDCMIKDDDADSDDDNTDVNTDSENVQSASSDDAMAWLNMLGDDEELPFV